MHYLLSRLVAGLLIVASSNLFAFTVNPELPRQTVIENVSVITETERLSYQQIVEQPASNWLPVNGPINAGYTDQGHWYQIRLHNPGTTELPRLLEISYPLLDHIELYVSRDGSLVSSYITGDALPFHERPLEHRNFIFPIMIPAGDQLQLYLRIQTAGALQVPMTLWEERTFHSESEKGLAGRSIFYGILIVMAGFNLFLFFSLRERTYLQYVMVVVPMLLLMTSMHGVSFQYVYPDWPRVHEKIILIIVPVTLIVLSLFTMGFFDLRQTRPAWHRGFQIMVALAAACVAGAFFLPYGISTRLSVFLALPVCIANISAGMLFWRGGEMSARLFSLGWFSLLGASVLMLLNKIGVLPSMFITEHGVPLGASTQALLFSFALASRFNQERDARIQAVRAQQKAQEQFLYAASHNEVTRLPNQVLFEQVVSKGVDSGHAGEYGICVLQLRHFGDVRKTLGHEHINVLQCEIANRLNQALSGHHGIMLLDQEQTANSYAAHLEGGRFAFAALTSQRQSLIELVQALSRTMAEPITFHGLQLEFGFLFGIAMRDKQQTIPALIREASIAFEQADQKRDGICVYRASMSPYSTRRLDLMTDLRFAIEQDALTSHFQPRISLKDSSLQRFEALVRWHHPEHGDISPAEFIPLAEKTGLISPLTRWMLDHALQFLQLLRANGCEAGVSINISASSLLEPEFLDQLQTLMQEHGAHPADLMLEITDSGFSGSSHDGLIRQMLEDLHKLGIQLALDNFGSSHHTLAEIRDLPLNEVLISREFIQRMSEHSEDATIVRSTVEMCHQLEFSTVATGVEDAATIKALQQTGCGSAQGYHISRPLPADDALFWWQQRSGNPGDAIIRPTAASGSGKAKRKAPARQPLSAPSQKPDQP
ncbi:MAG: EAL domain-containing protein [Alcanivoracaceae bacterium]|nr:EAL domain-containing protein [Alcanivoracaceae bacterium]